MRKNRYRVGVVALHPIQYQAGLWRTMAEHPRLDVEVLYLDPMGVDGTIEPVQGTRLEWDLPLLDGYCHRFLPNLSARRFHPILGRINPIVFSTVLRTDYDVIVVHGYQPISNWLAMAAARLSGKIIVYRGEGTMLAKPSHAPWLTEPKLAVNKLFVANAQAVAFSSQDNRRYQLARGASSASLFSMPCAVDNDLLSKCAAEGTSREAWRAARAIDTGQVVVCSVGRFTDRKRMADIIEAFTRPELRELDDLHLALVGSGPELESLQRQVSKHGLDERVHFLGFLNQRGVVEVLQAADLFVMASSMDPSPKAMSEALFFGLPVICSDRVGTATDFVLDDENGWQYACGDVAALAEHLQTLARDATLRAEMGRASRQLAAANDFQHATEALVDKLDEITSKPGS